MTACNVETSSAKSVTWGHTGQGGQYCGIHIHLHPNYPDYLETTFYIVDTDLEWETCYLGGGQPPPPGVWTHVQVHVVWTELMHLSGEIIITCNDWHGKITNKDEGYCWIYFSGNHHLDPQAPVNLLPDHPVLLAVHELLCEVHHHGTCTNFGALMLSSCHLHHRDLVQVGGKKLSSSELPRQGGVGGHRAPVAARHGAGQCDSPTKSHATNCIRPVRRTSTTTASHCSNSWRSVKQLCLFCFLWDCRICVST